MELVKNRWSVSQSEVERLCALPKKELIEIIKGFNLGSGVSSRKKANKDVYNTIKTNGKLKKVHQKRVAKPSEPDNIERQQSDI